MLLPALLVLTVGCGGPIQSDELARRIDTIGSLASEGKLLGEDRARDRAPRTFVRVHARELADDADHEAQKLADASAEGRLLLAKAGAVTLAQDVSSTLRDLQVMPADKAVARRAAGLLRSYATAADALAAGLWIGPGTGAASGW